MTTVVLNAPAAAPIRFGFLTKFIALFASTRRFERLFELSDAQLVARGLDRDALVRNYISGIGHN